MTPSLFPVRHRLRGIALALPFTLLAGTALAADPPAGALGATLEGLLEHARAHNPDLRMQALEAQAARAAVDPAGALPDPRFQLELMDFTNAMTPGESASILPGEVGETRYRVVQPIPFWGKRGLRGGVAEAEAAQADARLDGVRLEVERDIKMAHAAHYRAVRQAAILRETLDLVQGLERLVLTRYSVGLVPQQDALRAQSEITRLKIELVESERRRRAAAARIAALLDLEPGSPLAAPLALPERRDPPAHAELVRRAREHSPELLAERHSIAAAERSRDLVHRERWPNFAVGLTNNRPRSGTDSWDLMFEVEIPLQQGARRGQEREAERRRDAARERVRAVEARLSGRIGEALAGYASSLEAARLLEATLLPQADANLRAALADYETGRVNFGTLIEAEAQILETRLRVLDARVEGAERLAELEMLVGAEL